jgi:DNA topoisomerase-1
MEKKEEIKESLQEERREPCPKCGKELVVKWGRNGRFIACTGYPDCRYTRPLEEETQKTSEVCIQCGSPMVIRTGRYGRFLACSKYPDCKFTKPFSVGVACPEEGCSGVLVEKRSGRGKTFYGCSRYPDCRFATWYFPVPTKCIECGNPFMEKRASKTKGVFLKCPKCQAETKSSED